MNSVLERIERIKSSIEYAKRNLKDIEIKTQEYHELRNKTSLTPTDNGDVEQQLKAMREKNKRLNYIETELENLHKLKEIELEAIKNSEKQLGETKPEEKEYEQNKKKAQEKISGDLRKYLDCVINAHKISEEIIEAKNKFDCYVPDKIKSKTGYIYWLQCQRQRLTNTFQRLLDSSGLGHINILEK